MADESKVFRSVPSQPRDSTPADAPLGDTLRLREAAKRHGEPIEDWCHRMNTSDEPEAVAFRERWAAIWEDKQDQ